MGIEERYDIAFVAAMALREKQVQQNYRPIIAVHKWFARRPGTLFRGLTLAEFCDQPLTQCFFRANDFPGKTVADPFMGGGTPLLEANRVGCDVQGFDINPMAAWIVREEIEHLDEQAYRQAANSLIDRLASQIGTAYQTNCPTYGDQNVPVKYFLWVKVLDCELCGRQIDLFPGYILADNTRHPHHVLVCANCGELNEVDDIGHPGACAQCSKPLLVSGLARHGHCTCPFCNHVNAYPQREAGPPRHRMFAIEYYNPLRKDRHRGRFFKRPDAQDLANYDAVAKHWQSLAPQFTPDQEIPPGDETDRLHRWGYKFYRDLFNERQLLGLELSCRHIAGLGDRRIQSALATNLSDLLRYQNMLCRYDTMALKSLDIFSVHGFPVGLVQCESNLVGIVDSDGTNVGSGGWTNIVDKYERAKHYCQTPFEVRGSGNRKTLVPIHGEWIGEHYNGRRSRSVSLHCTSSTSVHLKPSSLDAVFTDPPYYDNVQYGELMDFCYVWLRRIVGNEPESFDKVSTRSPDELTGNATQDRGLYHFTAGLASVYSAMAQALKPGAPLAFTFHHNQIEAYHAIGVAILDAGLICTATLPCPAEMGGSIHIHGTGSSIVDSVFVCRSAERRSCNQTIANRDDLASVVRDELVQLRIAGMKPTAGDVRCIVYGNLTRMVIRQLHEDWDRERTVASKLDRFASASAAFGTLKPLIDELAHTEANDATLGAMAPLFGQE